MFLDLQKVSPRYPRPRKNNERDPDPQLRTRVPGVPRLRSTWERVAWLSSRTGYMFASAYSQFPGPLELSEFRVGTGDSSFSSYTRAL